ncbi:Alpha/Beta hydrolase protein, partial [Mycena haematopus]
TLGVGDGLTDPISQYPGYITYAGSNPYHALVSSSVIKSANTSWNKASTGCKARITACNNGGSNSVCSAAQSYCNDNILSPLVGDYDVYYVPSGSDDPYPPDISSYLDSIQKKVGAEVTWQETNDDVYNNFAATGDWMRSSLPDLELVINSGVRVTIYDGDADYILNFNGVEAMIASLNTKFSTEFNQQTFAPYKVNGLLAGQFKTAGTFSYVRIYGAGHEVPAYKNGTLAVGQAAFQFFSQTMANQSLSSTIPPRGNRICLRCGAPTNLYICNGVHKDGLAIVAALFTAEQAAAKLAALLGLTPTGFEVKHTSCADATQKLRDLWTGLMPCEGDDPTDPILCAFCAKFLPSLVSAYKASPCVEGPYHCMLLAVLQGNYFAKYMRTPLGSELYAFFANQVVIGNHPCESVVGLKIFATYAHEYKGRMRPLSDDTLTRLKDWLRIKGEESLEVIRVESSQCDKGRSASPDVVFHKQTLSNIVSVLNIMDGRLKSEAMQLTLTRRETFDHYAEKHEDGKKLTRFECSRCQTVAYCCRVHQKEDWSRHKERCFETAY